MPRLYPLTPLLPRLSAYPPSCPAYLLMPHLFNFAPLYAPRSFASPLLMQKIYILPTSPAPMQTILIFPNVMPNFFNSFPLLPRVSNFALFSFCQQKLFLRPLMPNLSTFLIIMPKNSSSTKLMPNIFAFPEIMPIILSFAATMPRLLTFLPLLPNFSNPPLLMPNRFPFPPSTAIPFAKII